MYGITTVADKLVVHSTKPKKVVPKSITTQEGKSLVKNSFPLINHHKQATETRDYTIFTQWMSRFILLY